MLPLFWGPIALLCLCHSVHAQSDPLLRSYIPQLQQLALVTSGGLYCAPVAMPLPGTASNTTGGWGLACQSRQMPSLSSFNLNIKLQQQQYQPLLTVSSTFTITARPAAQSPLFGLQDGFLMSVPGGRAPAGGRLAAFAFESPPQAGVAGLPVAFGPSGSGQLFLTVVPSMPGALTKYCRVGLYTLVGVGGASGPTVPSMLVCDLLNSTNATRFAIQPQGWAWNYARTAFQSVLSGGLCGNPLGALKTTAVTCTNGTATGEQALGWSASYFSTVLTSAQLPMRSSAQFMVQAWATYSVPSAMWAVDGSGCVVATSTLGTTVAASQVAGIQTGLMMLKNDGPSRNTNITSGNTVLLQSARNGLFCGVTGPTSRIKCSVTLAQIQAAPVRAVYQFVYLESLAPAPTG